MTATEVVVGALVFGVGGMLALGAVKQKEAEGNLRMTVEKLKNLSHALIAYTADNGGRLPAPGAPGAGDWECAAKPEASAAWYNALPPRLKSKAVGSLAPGERQAFYEESHPLHLPGAPYPENAHNLPRPYFAMGMNAGLSAAERDRAVNLGAILDPIRTVLFLERGLPLDEKQSEHQKGFDGGPKADGRAFVGRHDGKGILVFADGHSEIAETGDLLDQRGKVRFPQEKYVWTLDPDDDPN